MKTRQEGNHEDATGGAALQRREDVGDDALTRHDEDRDCCGLSCVGCFR